MHAPKYNLEPSILYVDDEPAVRSAFRRVVQRVGLSVTLFETPEAALESIIADPLQYTVVCADFHMGASMDGATFLSKVADAAPQATRILVSGKFDVPRLVDAVNTGQIYQVVSKPWNSSALIPLLLRGNEHCRLARENTMLMERLEQRNQALQRMNCDLDALVMRRTHFLLDSLVSALDLRDTETQWHSRRVSAYARRLAEGLDIGGAQLLDVEYGALLHDIGKIGITDGILLKPGKLDEHEWSVMRTHPSLGHDLLSGIDFLQGAAQIVLEHHEKYDGSGYPRGLAGKQIVIGARIFSVVDALDVITTRRPYKKAKTFSWAREEIIRCSGQHFDPDVVEAFLSIDLAEWTSIQAEFMGDDGA